MIKTFKKLKNRYCLKIFQNTKKNKNTYGKKKFKK